jgi:hypothetical protein
MENLDRTVIVTALPQMRLSFRVTGYTLARADVIFAATVALAPIDSPRWPLARSPAIADQQLSASFPEG